MLSLCEKIKKQGTAVALGYFDGLHLGHKAVLDAALECAAADGFVPVVMLFDIHPKKLVSGDVPPILTTEEKKRQLLTDYGFTVADFDFRKAMNYSPEEFVEKILVDGLNVQAVSCGFDYRYGKDGKGNTESLKRELGKRGVKVIVEESVVKDGEKVSSTAIRKLITNGEIEKANGMLGRCFSYAFTVNKGDGLGRVLGFPTINQSFPQDHIVPKYGVYASKVIVDGVWYPSVTNVGVRPTVSSASLRSETCILDFNGDLYGKKVEVFLIKYLREEKKFPDLEELSRQVEKDIAKARSIYSEVNENE